MSIDKFRDWFEVVALVAVVGSLVAVVMELRQTQNAMQAEVYQARAFNGIEYNWQLAQDDELGMLQKRLYESDFDPSELSDADRSRAEKLMTIIRIDLDNEHFQYQRGLLDPGFYHGETAIWIKIAAPIWRSLGMLSPRPDFKAEVDRILADDSIVVPEL